MSPKYVKNSQNSIPEKKKKPSKTWLKMGKAPEEAFF